MVNRRTVTSGLLASLAAGLASCGSSTSLEDDTQVSAYGAKKKEKWSPFGDGLGKDTNPMRERRTTPATVKELMVPGPLKEMTLGRKGARVTMIEYFSLTCPVCHAFHKKTWPTFKKHYIDTGKIYFIAREFPIGRSSGNATIALRCNERNYFKLLNRYLASQRRWVSQDVRLGAIHAIAAPHGLTRAKFDSCLADQKLIAGINAVKQRGRDLGVIGTPTFFINGKQLRGVLTMDTLRAEIDPLLV